MTSRDLRNIHTTRNSCRDALPCANIALKLPQYFYLLMEKLLGHYFQVRSPYYQATQCNQKHLFLYPQGDRSGLGKPKKDKHHTTTTIHLPKPVSTDLAITPDSVLTNPIGKDGVTPSLEGWPTKAKEAPSPHEVRLTPLDTNPVF